jgi:hypothetical protein
MSGFSADWLALREAADSSARSRRLASTLPRKFPAIIDLGAGTGANLRWLAPQLDSAQRWTLIDKDSRLLTVARQATRVWAGNAGYGTRVQGNDLAISAAGFDCAVRTLELDLSENLRDLELPAGCLVTASALFDLVSRQWLEELVGRIEASRGFVLWTLSYDGTVVLDPATDDDATIIALLNRHQLTDKGFGAALGPDAWRVAQSLLEQAGFGVETVDSSWHCGADDRGLLQALIAGWAEAAIAMAPAEERLIDTWCKRRLTQAAAGKLRISVGHRDLAARPGGPQD